jgi:hypothetical protein
MADRKLQWFVGPKELPSPYWVDINTKLKEWSKSLWHEKDPYKHLDLLIFAAEKLLEYDTETVKHTSGDSAPSFYFISIKHETLISIWPDIQYYLALRQMGEINTQTITLFLETFYKLKNHEYTPLSDIIKLRIRRRYREYNRKFDLQLGRYHRKFGYGD